MLKKVGYGRHGKRGLRFYVSKHRTGILLINPVSKHSKRLLNACSTGLWNMNEKASVLIRYWHKILRDGYFSRCRSMSRAVGVFTEFRRPLDAPDGADGHPAPHPPRGPRDGGCRGSAGPTRRGDPCGAAAALGCGDSLVAPRDSRGLSASARPSLTL